MSWEESEIGNLCEVGRGSSPRPIINRAYFDGGNIPWIKIADATSSGKEIYETKEHVNVYGASFSRLLPIGSLILATSGVSLGQVKFLGVEGCIHDGWLYIKNYNGISKEFLYYKLIELEKHFHSESYGAAIQNINTEILRRTKILLPPLQTKKRIASNLSNYDDLIENNNKRIKLLEETAQNIYKEWFVNFRFPNYEHTKFDKESGLPMGWENTEIKNFATVVTGKTPSTKNSNYFGGDIPFIKTPDMHQNIYMDNVEQYLSLDGAESQSNKYLPKNTVIISCIGARAGVVAITSKPSQTNQQINAILPSNVRHNFWLYFSCKELESTIHAIGSSGATMTNVSKGKFENIKLNLPADKILQEYDNTVGCVFEQILILQQQNQKLKEARDILLPRLMNRTIEV